MRTLIVVRHKATAQDLWDSWGPFSQPLLALDPLSLRTTRELLDDDPDGTLITLSSMVRQGVTFPPDTLVLVGPGIDGAELEQIRARERRIQRPSSADMAAILASEAEADSEPDYIAPPPQLWRGIGVGLAITAAVGALIWFVV